VTSIWSIPATSRSHERHVYQVVNAQYHLTSMAVGTLKQVILFSKGTSLSHGVMGEMAEIEAYDWHCYYGGSCDFLYDF